MPSSHDGKILPYMGELESTHKGLVFWGVTLTKRLWKTGGLSYTRLRELLLSKISQLGYDPRGQAIQVAW